MEVPDVRSLFVGKDTSLAERMRLRSWEVIKQHFPDLGDMKILDLCGTES